MVGGAPGFSGAVKLAAEAALRVGAGLVSIATHPEHAAMLTVARPEIMCHAVTASEELHPLIEKANVIALGPGLQLTEWSKILFDTAAASHKPLIVDADALNWLAEHPRQNAHWVLTPHPGEAARLLKMTVQAVQENRVAAVQALQQKYGGVAVLKGAGTLVLSADHQPAICPFGNPGMATGGMGDVLTGVIAGLTAQHHDLTITAQLGVLVHALAGDLAAKQGERGMIASDLMPYLRQIVNL